MKRLASGVNLQAVALLAQALAEHANRPHTIIQCYDGTPGAVRRCACGKVYDDPIHQPAAHPPEGEKEEVK